MGKSRRRVHMRRVLRLPPELRNLVALYLAELWGEEGLKVLSQVNGTSRADITTRGDGLATSVTLCSSDRTVGWFAVLEKYHGLHTPRRVIDSNTRFWVTHSPFRYIRHLNLVITGLVVDQHIHEDDVTKMGRHLALLPLESLHLQTVYVDNLFNAVIQWPRQRVTDLVISLLRTSPTNEWTRPFFPLVFRPFPSLRALTVNLESVGQRTPRHHAHLLFELNARDYKFCAGRRGETISEKVERVGRNVNLVCPRLSHFCWTERRYTRWAGYETELMVHRKDQVGGRWIQAVHRTYREQQGVMDEHKDCQLSAATL